jgi:hypothetical protein
MTQHAKHSSTPGDESSSSNRNYLRDLLNYPEARKAIFVYVVGTLLLVVGGAYAVWRIDILKRYLEFNRAYALERDARWEKHIQGQAAATQEILRRLPPH